MDTVVTGIDRGGLDVPGRRTAAPPGTQAGVVLWTAGVEAPPVAAAVAAATGAATDRAGRIEVGDDLTIAGHPEIFVIGDLMSLRKLPGMAEVAMQSGHHAGPPDPARGGGPAPRPGRSGTATSARPPTSPAARRCCRPGRSGSAASPAGWPGCSSTSRS